MDTIVRQLMKLRSAPKSFHALFFLRLLHPDQRAGAESALGHHATVLQNVDVAIRQLRMRVPPRDGQAVEMLARYACAVTFFRPYSSTLMKKNAEALCREPEIPTSPSVLPHASGNMSVKEGPRVGVVHDPVFHGNFHHHVCSTKGHQEGPQRLGRLESVLQSFGDSITRLEAVPLSKKNVLSTHTQEYLMFLRQKSLNHSVRVNLTDGRGRVFHPLKDSSAEGEQEVLLTHDNRRVYKSAPYLWADEDQPSLGPVVCGRERTPFKDVEDLGFLEDMSEVFVHDTDKFDEKSCVVRRRPSNEADGKSFQLDVDGRHLEFRAVEGVDSVFRAVPTYLYYSEEIGSWVWTPNEPHLTSCARGVLCDTPDTYRSSRVLVDNEQNFINCKIERKYRHPEDYMFEDFHDEYADLHCDADSYLSEHSPDVASLAAGSFISGLTDVVTGKLDIALNLSRPPCHHATSERAEGFCLQNNVIIGCHHLDDLKLPNYKRVAIVDLDVHPPDGTAQCLENAEFKHLEEVRLISPSHFGYLDVWPASEARPGFCGADDDLATQGKRRTTFLPLPKNFKDGTYRFVMRYAVERFLQEFRPDVILLSLGTDAVKGEKYGGMISPKVFRDCALILRQCCPKIVVNFEGGYLADLIASSWKYFILGCLAPLPSTSPTMRTRKSANVKQMLLEVFDTLQKDFPLFSHGLPKKLVPLDTLIRSMRLQKYGAVTVDDIASLCLWLANEATHSRASLLGSNGDRTRSVHSDGAVPFTTVHSASSSSSSSSPSPGSTRALPARATSAPSSSRSNGASLSSATNLLSATSSSSTRATTSSSATTARWDDLLGFSAFLRSIVGVQQLSRFGAAFGVDRREYPASATTFEVTRSLIFMELCAQIQVANAAISTACLRSIKSGELLELASFTGPPGDWCWSHRTYGMLSSAKEGDQAEADRSTTAVSSEKKRSRNTHVEAASENFADYAPGDTSASPEVPHDSARLSPGTRARSNSTPVVTPQSPPAARPAKRPRRSMSVSDAASYDAGRLNLPSFDDTADFRAARELQSDKSEAPHDSARHSPGTRARSNSKSDVTPVGVPGSSALEHSSRLPETPPSANPPSSPALRANRNPPRSTRSSPYEQGEKGHHGPPSDSKSSRAFHGGQVPFFPSSPPAGGGPLYHVPSVFTGSAQISHGGGGPYQLPPTVAGRPLYEQLSSSLGSLAGGLGLNALDDELAIARPGATSQSSRRGPLPDTPFGSPQQSITGRGGVHRGRGPPMPRGSSRSSYGGHGEVNGGPQNDSANSHGTQGGQWPFFHPFPSTGGGPPHQVPPILSGVSQIPFGGDEEASGGSVTFSGTLGGQTCRGPPNDLRSSRGTRSGQMYCIPPSLLAGGGPLSRMPPTPSGSARSSRGGSKEVSGGSANTPGALSGTLAEQADHSGPPNDSTNSRGTQGGQMYSIPPLPSTSGGTKLQVAPIPSGISQMPRSGGEEVNGGLPDFLRNSHGTLGGQTYCGPPIDSGSSLDFRGGQTYTIYPLPSACGGSMSQVASIPSGISQLPFGGAGERNGGLTTFSDTSPGTLGGQTYHGPPNDYGSSLDSRGGQVYSIPPLPPACGGSVSQVASIPSGISQLPFGGAGEMNGGLTTFSGRSPSTLGGQTCRGPPNDLRSSLDYLGGQMYSIPPLPLAGCEPLFRVPPMPSRSAWSSRGGSKEVSGGPPTFSGNSNGTRGGQANHGPPNDYGSSRGSCGGGKMYPLPPLTSAGGKPMSRSRPIPFGVPQMSSDGGGEMSGGPPTFSGSSIGTRGGQANHGPPNDSESSRGFGGGQLYPLPPLTSAGGKPMSRSLLIPSGVSHILSGGGGEMSGGPPTFSGSSNGTQGEQRNHGSPNDSKSSHAFRGGQVPFFPSSPPAGGGPLYHLPSVFTGSARISHGGGGPYQLPPTVAGGPYQLPSTVAGGPYQRPPTVAGGPYQLPAQRCYSTGRTLPIVPVER